MITGLIGTGFLFACKESVLPAGIIILVLVTGSFTACLTLLLREFTVVTLGDLSVKAGCPQYCPSSQGAGAGAAGAPVNNSGLK